MSISVAQSFVIFDPETSFISRLVNSKCRLWNQKLRHPTVLLTKLLHSIEKENPNPAPKPALITQARLRYKTVRAQHLRLVAAILSVPSTSQPYKRRKIGHKLLHWPVNYQ